jgi:hypothetical protein
MRAGGLPISTLGAFGLAGAGAGSGVLQALLSLAEDQGSNIAALLWETRGGLGAAIGFCGAAGGAERLNAELRLDDWGGDESFVGGGAGGAGDVNPAKSSSANRSWEAEAFGLETAVDDCANAKSRLLDGFRRGEA